MIQYPHLPSTQFLNFLVKFPQNYSFSKQVGLVAPSPSISAHTIQTRNIFLSRPLRWSDPAHTRQHKLASSMKFYISRVFVHPPPPTTSYFHPSPPSMYSSLAHYSYHTNTSPRTQHTRRGSTYQPYIYLYLPRYCYCYTEHNPMKMIRFPSLRLLLYLVL